MLEKCFNKILLKKIEYNFYFLVIYNYLIQVKNVFN